LPGVMVLDIYKRTSEINKTHTSLLVIRQSKTWMRHLMYVCETIKL